MIRKRTLAQKERRLCKLVSELINAKRTLTASSQRSPSAIICMAWKMSSELR